MGLNSFGSDMSGKNRLLNVLSEADYSLLAPQLETVDLVHRQDLERPHAPFEFVYFPEGAILSTIAISGSEKVETCMTGWEGMTAMSIVNGIDRTPFHTFVQAPGPARRIAVEHFRTAFEASRSLQAACLLFAEARSIQIAHTALSNGRHSIEERLARWILMCLDRQEGSSIELTHEFLSLMLGVRRAGVTTALHLLEGKQLVRASRALLTVRDRAGLEAVAGDAYGVPESEYRRLTGQDIRAVPARAEAS
jgi:hypothetical protein